MENAIATVKIDASELEKVINDKVSTTTKTHPRMYSIGMLSFNELPKWSGIDIPVSVKTDILRAIEEVGYSITYMDDDMVSINAIKKQLQHDA